MVLWSISHTTNNTINYYFALLIFWYILLASIKEQCVWNEEITDLLHKDREEKHEETVHSLLQCLWKHPSCMWDKYKNSRSTERTLHTSMLTLHNYHNALIIWQCKVHDSPLDPTAVFSWLVHIVFLVILKCCIINIFIQCYLQCMNCTDMWKESIMAHFRLLLETMKTNTIMAAKYTAHCT